MSTRSAFLAGAMLMLCAVLLFKLAYDVASDIQRCAMTSNKLGGK
jgi:hypothetical protein